MWHGTRSDAMIVVQNLVLTLRAIDRGTEADALEHVLFKVPRDESAEHFQIEGAGEIEVGSSLSRTGNACGPHVGVSWGTWGYAGGVMDTLEVHRLIDHLRSVVYDEPPPLVVLTPEAKNETR